jgi:hypothetical protein
VIVVLAAALATGLIVGARFRVPALLAASAGAALAAIGTGLAEGLGAGTALLFAVVAIALVQLGYLVGLFGGLTRRRGEGR